jgi:hypothetical protein
VQAWNHLLLLGPAPRRRRHPEVVQPDERQHAEPDGKRLPGPDRPRHRGAREHERREQREADAVGLPVADAVAAKAVLFAVSVLCLQFGDGGPHEKANGDASNDGGDGARAGVAGDAAAGGDGAEDEGDYVEGLAVLAVGSWESR